MLQMFHGPRLASFVLAENWKNNSVKSIIDNKLFFQNSFPLPFVLASLLTWPRSFKKCRKLLLLWLFHFVFCFLRLLYYLGSDIIFQQSFLLVWCRKMMQHISSIAAGDMKLISVDQKQREVLFSHENSCLNFESCPSSKSATVAHSAGTMVCNTQLWFVIPHLKIIFRVKSILHQHPPPFCFQPLHGEKQTKELNWFVLNTSSFLGTILLLAAEPLPFANLLS